MTDTAQIASMRGEHRTAVARGDARHAEHIAEQIDRAEKAATAERDTAAATEAARALIAVGDSIAAALALGIARADVRAAFDAALKAAGS